jgi:uncharacterized DUF497 family protein
MEITELDWDEENLRHIQRHGVSPDEVEEVLFLKPWVRRTRQDRYLGLGQALSGRYLLVVFEYLGHGRARTVTAREQDRRERWAYVDWMGE